jgi:hypothetical protein
MLAAPHGSQNLATGTHISSENCTAINHKAASLSSGIDLKSCVKFQAGLVFLRPGLFPGCVIESSWPSLIETFSSGDTLMRSMS